MLLPWKSASSTVNARLEPFNESPYEGFYDYNPYLQRVVHQHLCYSDFKCLPESALGYQVGAFVRNPYDRVYSGFVQLQRDIQTQPNQSFAQPWVKNMVMRQLSENYAQLAASDFEFNKWVDLISEHQVYEIGKNSSFPLHPAHYWTGLQGNKAIDFVGKVENFEADFDLFCSKVGISVIDRVNANVSTSVSVIDKVVRPRYLDRMTSATLSKINSLFSEDFDLFGYKRFHTCE
jgi:ribosomal protein S17E